MLGGKAGNGDGGGWKGGRGKATILNGKEIVKWAFFFFLNKKADILRHDSLTKHAEICGHKRI